MCRDRNVKPSHRVLGETPQGPGLKTLISSITISSEKKGLSLKKLGENIHRAQERLLKNTFCSLENPSLSFWLPHSLGILVSWNLRTGLSPECDSPAAAEPRHDASLLQELAETDTIQGKPKCHSGQQPGVAGLGTGNPGLAGALAQERRLRSCPARGSLPASGTLADYQTPSRIA